MVSVQQINPKTPEQEQLVTIFGQLANKLGETIARKLLQGAFTSWKRGEHEVALGEAQSVLDNPQAYIKANDERERELATLTQLAVEYGHTAA